MTRSELTRDALCGGALTLLQPRSGYRVNVDSVLLAAFARRGRVAKVAVDLGAGVGALGLLALRMGAAQSVVLVERDAELVRLAGENVAANALVGSVVERDLERQGLPPSLAQRAELVLCNPPFFPAASGTPSQRAAAARGGELAPFVRATARALSGPRTRAAFCYPAAALPELLACASEARLVAKRLRLVHARADSPARLALVELRLAKPGGLVVEPPLVEWQNGRTRSAELARLVNGDFSRERG